MTDILTVKDVSFSYGEKAVLHSVSLEVQKGEIVSILGPSGVGSGVGGGVFGHGFNPTESTE